MVGLGSSAPEDGFLGLTTLTIIDDALKLIEKYKA